MEAPAAPPADAPIADLADIFGEEVTDTPNALAKSEAPAVTEGAPSPGDEGHEGHAAPDAPEVSKPRRKRGEPAPVVVTDEHLSDAVGLLTMSGEAFAMYKRGQWSGHRNAAGRPLDAAFVNQYVEQLRFSSDEVMTMARPLARGMAEHGVRMPWYAQFFLAALPLVGPRLSIAQGVDAALAKAAKGQAEESPALPASEG